MKDRSAACCPGPFDYAALDRQLRMGLIRADGGADREALAVMARVYAGLFYESLCEAESDRKRVCGVCRRLIGIEAEGDARQTLLAICMQYDAMMRPLPEPLWWIVGNRELVEPFVHSFANALAGFIQN